MNMVSIAVDEATRFIERSQNVRSVSLSSNLCSDKKPAGANILMGRGKCVIGEARIGADVVKKMLGTTPRKIAEVVRYKNWIGSSLAMAPTYMNAHYANIIAGIYVACGQDLAQIVESAMGVTIAEVDEPGNWLYFSVTIPCLETGILGGGAALPYARECLSMMGCHSPSLAGDTSRKFAEVICAAVLAGEISLTACLAQGTLAATHSRMRKLVR
jgi:hydroxymethylglutaryl-CoA reductase (NADPH)